MRFERWLTFGFLRRCHAACQRLFGQCVIARFIDNTMLFEIPQHKSVPRINLPTNYTLRHVYNLSHYRAHNAPSDELPAAELFISAAAIEVHSDA